MKTNNTCTIKTLVVVACLTSLGIQAAPRSTPVTVVNDATTPVPVTGAVEATVSGMVTVDNGPANPVPVVIADPVQVNMGTNYRYIGNSPFVIQPSNVGLIGMNRTCHFKYGSEARMCTTKEFFQTPNPQLLTIKSWIHPSVGEPRNDPVTGLLYYMDYSGRQLRPEPGTVSVTCNGWLDGTTGRHGATVTSDEATSKAYASASSCNERITVACCKPQ